MKNTLMSTMIMIVIIKKKYMSKKIKITEEQLKRLVANKSKQVNESIEEKKEINGSVNNFKKSFERFIK